MYVHMCVHNHIPVCSYAHIVYYTYIHTYILYMKYSVMLGRLLEFVLLCAPSVEGLVVHRYLWKYLTTINFLDELEKFIVKDFFE